MRLNVRVVLSLVVLSLLGAIGYVQGRAYFTSTLSRVLFVSLAKNKSTSARIPWSYHVDNRSNEFASYSPKWSIFNGTEEQVILHEDKFKGWQWEIAESCPARLRKRVSKESTATLVISDITTEDSGTYGCTLVLKNNQPETSKVDLKVIVPPEIYSNDTVNVTEYGNLTVYCTATGFPTPNVTWTKREVELAFEYGRAVLSIYNITRNQSGIYTCNAINNPEKPSGMNKPTTVNVQYPIEFDEGLSSKSVKACLGKKNVELKSVAHGNPIPTHYWLSPDKSKSQTDSVESSLFRIKEVEEMDFGNWTVNITNGVRSFYYIHNIEVKKLVDDCESPSGGKEGLSTAEKVGIGLGVLAPVAIMALAGGIYYYKKKKGSNPVEQK